MRQTTKHFPFVPENSIINKDDFNDFMKKTKPQKHVSKKNLSLD